MTNRDRADRLMQEAAVIFREISAALAERSWNLTVRRAQEVVELVLKALLAEMGVDYPKVHDVAPHFVRVVRARGLDVDEATLMWLEEVSGKLATLRAPAFYFEAEYGESTARQAASDAEQVMAFGREFLRRLRSSP